MEDEYELQSENWNLSRFLMEINYPLSKEKLYQQFKSRLLEDEEFIKLLVNEVFNFPVTDLDISVAGVDIRKKED